MSVWPCVPLGELCDVSGGDAAPQNDNYFDGGTVPFVRMRDLGRYHFTDNLAETDDKLTEAAVASLKMKVFEPGCILFPRSGSVFLNHRAILGARACIVSHIGVLTNIAPKIHSHFLYRYLQTYDMAWLSKKTTGVDSISFSDVKRVPVPLPPLPEQERIVRLLDEADELRRLRAEADRRTAALIPAIFHEMFGDPASNPKGWTRKVIADLASVQGGLQLSPVRDLYPKRPYLRVANVQRGYLMLNEIKEIGVLDSELPRVTLNPDDLLLVEGNGNPNEIGRAALWDGSIEGCVHQNHLIRVRCDQNHLLPQYLLAFVNSTEGRSYFLSSGNTTSGLSTISTSVVKKCCLPTPPIALQKEFAARVAQVRAMESGQAASRGRLEALFQAALHRAFRGEL